MLPHKADSFELPMLNGLLKVKQQSLYQEEAYEPYINSIKTFADTVEKDLALNLDL
jgi:hypothetical protein